MAFWILLGSGLALLVAAAILGITHHKHQKNTLPREHKLAKKPILTQPVDEIDAYWGSAQASPVSAPVVQEDCTPKTAHRCAAVEQAPGGPRVLGDDARRLGIAYFQYLLDNKVLPRGSVSLTNESNIIIAQNALRNKQQSATLSHSAVAQRIGHQALCIFEPLSMPVENVERAIECLAPLVSDKSTFFVLESTEFAEPECLNHIPKICAEFKIPQTHVFIRQTDGSFINYIEDIHNFAPSRLDPWQMPESFFSELLDYAQAAFDEGDSETVMRALAPLVEPLYERIQTRRDFAPILVAQALNLTGMTNRALEHEAQAVSCFEASYQILRKLEDYEAIKAVEANLGITLALMQTPTEATLNKAVHHLKDVTELNPKDDEAWLYLGHAYLKLYQLCHLGANLMRSKRAFAQAYALAPSPKLAQCLADLDMPVPNKEQVPAQMQLDGAPSAKQIKHAEN